ncbi:UNVERIFIED_CONTAM: hypothetical protein HDU68_003895 [Siphonaria sp. JEL0065]|nr:hypothetical protein HDU68_003895 [Siphonaria sp. JEL0065]
MDWDPGPEYSNNDAVSEERGVNLMMKWRVLYLMEDYDEFAWTCQDSSNANQGRELPPFLLCGGQDSVPWTAMSFSIFTKMSTEQIDATLLFDEEDVVAEEVELPVVFLADDDEIEYGALPPPPSSNSVSNSKAPDAVAAFAKSVASALSSKNVWELNQLYEHHFAKISEKLFAKNPWPSADKLSHISTDPLFVALYKDLVFRHKHAKLSPTLEDRIAAYDNYQTLFGLFLAVDKEPLDAELPNQWIWDIVDEFIYQFQSFCQFRAKSVGAAATVAALKSRPDVWNVLNVLNVLYSLVKKSTINEQLWVAKHGGDVGWVDFLNSVHSAGEKCFATSTGSEERAKFYSRYAYFASLASLPAKPSPFEAAGTFGSRPLYRMLGYFSIIGLCRVHTLLGDYTLALKALENIELNKKGLFARVTACHITTYYYVGFSYMMMRRWSDAVKAFTHILLFISRTKQYHSRSYQFEVIQKKGEQMYALLTICLALCPQRIDENVHSLLREKYGDQLSKLQKDGEESIPVFEELFNFACPKFISPAVSTSTIDAAAFAQQQQLRTFLTEVRQHQSISTIRSYLKLYTSLKIDKLASFVGKTPQELRTELLVYKHKTRQRRWESGSVLEGEYSSPGDLDFYIKQDMIHISESKVERRIGEWFVRQISKFEDTIGNLNRLG